MIVKNYEIKLDFILFASRVWPWPGLCPETLYSSPLPCPWTISTRMPGSTSHSACAIWNSLSPPQFFKLEGLGHPDFFSSWNFSSAPYGSISTSCGFYCLNSFSAVPYLSIYYLCLSLGYGLLSPLSPFTSN